ncbi:MAG: hypothetical protein AAEJ04_03345 [Planctomycetota bacterium]
MTYVRKESDLEAQDPPTDHMKNLQRVLKVTIFVCASVTFVAGFVVAFVLEPFQEPVDLEPLLVSNILISVIGLLAVVFGKIRFGGMLEQCSSIPQFQKIWIGIVGIVAVCQSGGMFWAVNAYLFAEPVYCFGSLMHAFAILLLWPGNGVAEGDFVTDGTYRDDS